MNLEDQFILRLPLEQAKKLRSRLRDSNDELKDVALHFQNGRYGGFKMGQYEKPVLICDLPCLVESHKTYKGTNLFKSSDISKILIVEPGAKELNDVIKKSKNMSRLPKAFRPEDVRRFTLEDGLTIGTKGIVKKRQSRANNSFKKYDLGFPEAVILKYKNKTSPSTYKSIRIFEEEIPEPTEKEKEIERQKEKEKQKQKEKEMEIEREKKEKEKQKQKEKERERERKRKREKEMQTQMQIEKEYSQIKNQQEKNNFKNKSANNPRKLNANNFQQNQKAQPQSQIQMQIQKENTKQRSHLQTEIIVNQIFPNNDGQKKQTMITNQANKQQQPQQTNPTTEEISSVKMKMNNTQQQANQKPKQTNPNSQMIIPNTLPQMEETNNTQSLMKEQTETFTTTEIQKMKTELQDLESQITEFNRSMQALHRKFDNTSNIVLKKRYQKKLLQEQKKLQEIIPKKNDLVKKLSPYK
ncbi:transcription initiation factor tfiid 55 kd subunit-related [Anaeramoeba flamelloides]|uniref:Transcription initiation factor tfiid 55 kd subunit-related n=1 Tax=Anaeramoeba flamelloides TaxID=1746091 RepID=A0AAV8AIV5_9EUKA|nr:transcription initiation factor tfiid 55 kd subunit-related [Anaeramoeba flamelloides]